MENRLNSLLNAANWDASKLVIKSDRLGATNQSLICEYEGKKFIVRMGSPNGDVLSINRHAENAVLHALSDAGICEYPTYYDEETGDKIAEFIDGRELTSADLLNDGIVNRVAKAIKQLHSLSTSHKFDPYTDIENKLASIRKANIHLHMQFNEAYSVYEEARRRVMKNTAEYIGLCHNDLFESNLIVGNDAKIHIIDFEYAGMGDVFYDFSCVCAHMEPESIKKFLTSYYGYCDAQMLARLKNFRVINLMWNGTWAYLKSLDTGIGDTDYVNFGDLHVAAILGMKI